ncbi:cupin domain-containing protein [Halosimplex pelagicum]|uniref:Cupin domain-containing protein n=1 Tax=Halosimplex pelagicum TaxID=869886 RepID=A0A7D5TVS2_9EURY|nr:cupin domain-containing protein [Halosimplex pelagicum]QLH84232.1 cupin domain-containing protein [Halosimplex pelagicum]
MERVAFDDADESTDGPTAAIDRRGLSGPLETDGVAINRYRVPPGEGLPSGLHAHADQEEIFLVIDGTATFETLPGREPDAAGDDPRTGREVTVAAGEAVRFAPGEYQSGDNRGSDDLVALAIGAPRETADVRVPVRCPDCGEADFALDAAGDGLTFRCPDCDAERVPAPCPDCGSDAMTTTLDGDALVAACDDCGAVFDSPPLRD